MKTEDLPDWQDIDLQSDMIDPPMPLDALQQFIYIYEATEERGPGYSTDAAFRERLSKMISFCEQAQSNKILNMLITRAKEFKANKLKGSYITALGLIRDVEAIINPGSNMKNGHLCGALCEICKHQNDTQNEL